MSDVKVIPISPKYRENWENTFGKGKPNSSGLKQTYRDMTWWVNRNLGTDITFIGDELIIPAIHIPQKGKGK